MKKTLCILTVLVLLISCCAITTRAADTETLDLAHDVQARYEGLLEGISPEPIVRTLYIEDDYDFSSWISVGLIDYSICQEHGTNCPNQLCNRQICRCLFVAVFTMVMNLTVRTAAK